MDQPGSLIEHLGHALSGKALSNWMARATISNLLRYEEPTGHWWTLQSGRNLVSQTKNR